MHCLVHTFSRHLFSEAGSGPGQCFSSLLRGLSICPSDCRRNLERLQTRWEISPLALPYAFLLLLLLSFTACGILVLTGIKPKTPALEVWSLNRWAVREVPGIHSITDQPSSWQHSLPVRQEVLEIYSPSFLIFKNFIHFIGWQISPPPNFLRGDFTFESVRIWPELELPFDYL